MVFSFFLLFVALFEFPEYFVEIDQCSPAQFAYLGGVVLGFSYRYVQCSSPHFMGLQSLLQFLCICPYI